MKKGKELKPHIGIFGRRNTGKSSFINTLTGQEIAIVSNQAGTTTDPVKKSIEIFGIGPAIIIDTAGIDDHGELGHKRVERSLDIIRSIDAAILLTDNNILEGYELELISWFEDFHIPYFVIHNKSDLKTSESTFRALAGMATGKEVVDFSCTDRQGLNEVYRMLREVLPETSYRKKPMLGDLITKGDLVLLVTPIDSEAPEGRLKLPMVMVQRDILDHGGIVMALKETELEEFLNRSGRRPKLTVTDGSRFKQVANLLPADYPLTSFSIILARTKGDFDLYLEHTLKIRDLKDGDRILLLESCTHEVTCDNISRFKLPAMMKEVLGLNLQFDVINGLEKMDMDMSAYALVIQCGACVITRKQLENRLRPALHAGAPRTNYEMTLAYLGGILERALSPFAAVEHEINHV
jgi:[FeFe] hydrogenase H-cluster maturation GTPase HydF